jgi:hypothetical protein
MTLRWEMHEEVEAKIKETEKVDMWTRQKAELDI